MSRTRLTALLLALGVGAAGLTPAVAAPDVPAPAAREVAGLDPSRALHAATRELLRAPDADRVAQWRSALLRSVDPDDPEEEGSGSPREWSALYDAGDVDGDRRSDLVVMRDATTLVRSGRDGRVLLRREGSSLLPVSAAGAVRLVALDVEFQERSSGFHVEVRLQGLDRTGRVRWQHAMSGRLSFVGAGPAYAIRFENLPVMLLTGQRDAAGRPAMLLGSLSGAFGPEGAASQLDLGLLGAADGVRTALPAVHGVGSALPWAFPVAKAAATPCYATTAPTGPASRVTLVCDRSARWTRPAALLDPYVDAAGDFDGDGSWDLLVSTYGFEPAEPGEPGRGTRVLAFTDGRELGASALEGLCALLVDVNGDRQPDFMEVGFAEEGFSIRGVTLAGKQLWRRTIALRGSGSLEGHLGLDVDGDGVGDAFLRAEPRKGTAVAVAINGRNGRPLVVPGVDALLSPGLRPRGADLAVLEPVAGRLHATVLSGDRARPLLSVRVPGPKGKVLPGAVTAVDVSGDGRRDLVLVSRTGDRRLTTAVSSRGAVLWQLSERAPVRGSGPDTVVVVG